MDFVSRVNQNQSKHTALLVAEQAFRHNFPDAKIIGIDGVFNFLYMDETIPHLLAIIDYSFETEEWQCRKGKKYNQVRISVSLRMHRDFPTWVPVETVKVIKLEEFIEVDIKTAEFIVKTSHDAMREWNPKWELVPLPKKSQ
ncbi:MAG: hypothetical protein WC242_00160 [Candidatus Paceibacterota bacterium]|jgi:hypothetical protein